MISVGIDVSKEKSTVCILKPYGEIVSKPFEVCHVEKELSELILCQEKVQIKHAFFKVGLPCQSFCFFV